MINRVNERNRFISELENMNNEYFIVSFDIVRFRIINDIYGFKEGDIVLQELIDNCRALSKKIAVKSFIYEKDNIYLIIEKAEEEAVKGIIREIASENYSYDIKLRAAYRKVKDFNMAIEFVETIGKVIKRSKYTVEHNSYDFDASYDIDEYTAIKKDLITSGQSFFTLVYQPKINVKTNKVSSCEVLCRWNHPYLGMVSPGRFLPIISDLFKEVDFDLFVFERACKEIKSLKGDIKKFSVNISISTMKEENTYKNIYNIAKENGIDPKNVTIEILEDRSNGEYKMISSNIHYLRELGFNISIDDFGTGYSSYYRLSRLKCSEVKIPREFLLEENTDKHEIMLKAVIAMCKDLGCKIVIEGVETEAQKELAKDIGADYIQGFYYSKPLEKRTFVEYLKAQAAI